MQHYFRTARWLVGQGSVKLSASCRVRFLSPADAHGIAENLRRRTVYSRHAGPNDFYYQRATALEGTTVIEIFSGGVSAAGDLVEQARVAENAVAASFVLSGTRRRFLTSTVGRPGSHLDLHLVTRGTKLLPASTSSTPRNAKGLVVDAAATRRFTRNGFGPLYELAVSGTELGSRVRLALRWLLESRTDSTDESAVVKTATALESLLVIGREPTTRTLSERTAYLLSDDPGERQRISAAIQRFYGLRGDVVHGKQVMNSRSLQNALEFGDRIVVLLALVLSAQIPAWNSANDVQVYCDRSRWGHRTECRRPWPRQQLLKGLKRFP
jgi:hypothetical protein